MNLQEIKEMADKEDFECSAFFKRAQDTLGNRLTRDIKVGYQYKPHVENLIKYADQNNIPFYYYCGDGPGYAIIAKSYTALYSMIRSM